MTKTTRGETFKAQRSGRKRVWEPQCVPSIVARSTEEAECRGETQTPCALYAPQGEYLRWEEGEGGEQETPYAPQREYRFAVSDPALFMVPDLYDTEAFVQRGVEGEGEKEKEEIEKGVETLSSVSSWRGKEDTRAVELGLEEEGGAVGGSPTTSMVSSRNVRFSSSTLEEEESAVWGNTASMVSSQGVMFSSSSSASEGTEGSSDEASSSRSSSPTSPGRALQSVLLCAQQDPEATALSEQLSVEMERGKDRGEEGSDPDARVHEIIIQLEAIV